MPSWLITGSSRGLGLQFARQLSLIKSNVVIATCRRPDSASALQDLAKSATNVHIIKLDTDDEASVTASVSEVQRIVGAENGVDYVLNNAAITRRDDLASAVDETDLLETFKANVLGPIRVAHAYLPLIEQSERKVLMNMSSSMGSISADLGTKHTSYSMCKSALNMFTYKLSKEKPDIIVVSMDPGWNKTDMGGEDALLDPEVTVPSMIKILHGLTIEMSGSFPSVNRGGDTLQW